MVSTTNISIWKVELSTGRSRKKGKLNGNKRSNAAKRYSPLPLERIFPLVAAALGVPNSSIFHRSFSNKIHSETHWREERGGSAWQGFRLERITDSSFHKNLLPSFVEEERSRYIHIFMQKRRISSPPTRGGEEERIKLPEDASFYQLLPLHANLLSIIYLS